MQSGRINWCGKGQTSVQSLLYASICYDQHVDEDDDQVDVGSNVRLAYATNGSWLPLMHERPVQVIY